MDRTQVQDIVMKKRGCRRRTLIDNERRRKRARQRYAQDIALSRLDRLMRCMKNEKNKQIEENHEEDEGQTQLSSIDLYSVSSSIHASTTQILHSLADAGGVHADPLPLTAESTRAEWETRQPTQIDGSRLCVPKTWAVDRTTVGRLSAAPPPSPESGNVHYRTSTIMNALREVADRPEIGRDSYFLAILRIAHGVLSRRREYYTQISREKTRGSPKMTHRLAEWISRRELKHTTGFSPFLLDLISPYL